MSANSRDSLHTGHTSTGVVMAGVGSGRDDLGGG